MTGPHLVYVLRDYPSLSQTFVRNEILALRQRGCEVTVFALRDTPSALAPPEWGGPFEVVSRQPRFRGLLDLALVSVRHPRRVLDMLRQVLATGQRERWSALYLAPTLARRLGGRPVDACHTHFAFEHALPALYVSRLLGTPASITVHAADIYRRPDEAVELLQQFDTVVTVCTFNVDLLREHGLTRPQLVAVPCGVEVPPAAGPGQGSGTGAPLVVSVGRFVPKKGFRGLVRAWVAVVATYPSARLELVGDGPDREPVERLAGELGIAHAVVFRGALRHDDVLARIAAADVFVLACAVPADGDTDALPVVLREAMARSRAVVSTRVAGVPEAVGPDAGWLVEPDDPQALSEALIAAMGDPAEAARRGVAGRERVLARATLPMAAAELEKALTGFPAGRRDGDPHGRR